MDNGMNDKHQEVMEKVYSNNNISYVKKLFYEFEYGKKDILFPQTLEQEKALVSKYGKIKYILPVELLPSEEKTSLNCKKNV